MSSPQRPRGRKTTRPSAKQHQFRGDKPHFLLPHPRRIHGLEENRSITRVSRAQSHAPSRCHELFKDNDELFPSSRVCGGIRKLTRLLKSSLRDRSDRQRWRRCSSQRYTDTCCCLPLSRGRGYHHLVQNALSLLVSPDAPDFTRPFFPRCAAPSGRCARRYPLFRLPYVYI